MPGESRTSIFIYPFFFRQERYRELVGSVWRDPCWKLEFVTPEREEDRQHLRYLYPHARDFLFPTHGLGREEIEKLFPPWKVYGSSGTAPARPDGPNRRQWEVLRSWQVIRWRWDPEGGEAERRFRFDLRCEGGNLEVECKFHKVSLLVFPTGVGLLLMEVGPARPTGSGSGGLDDPRAFGRWVEQFSTLEDMPSGTPAAELSFEKGREKLKDFIEGKLLSFLAPELRAAGSYAAGEASLIRYVVWCDGGPGEGEAPNGRLNRLLRELSPRCRGPLKKRALFVGIDTRAYFTAQGATVVCCGSSSFPCDRLLRFWRRFYLDLFLHALYHRLSLLRFAHELSCTEELIRSADRVRQLRRRFLEFTNKAWFGHVVHADYGHMIWRKWQEVLETQSLYEEVKGYLTELGDFLEEGRRSWYKSLSFFLVVFGSAVSLISTLFSAGVLRPLPGWTPGPLAVAGVCAGVFAAAYAVAGAAQWHYFRKVGRWKLEGAPERRGFAWRGRVPGGRRERRVEGWGIRGFRPSSRP
ncbi:hypothetical protein Adeg_0802 [Ammonifex degensii KC4]|uniref:Uncharacterized protein n=2 Tax=Ammonifex degensii TaxID=42838 RepID=C9RCG7_AMMDK|nr:hypothetical protein Adeg_0802 [Ammonifex degensii KC4]